MVSPKGGGAVRALIWLDSWSNTLFANMTPPEREAGFVVPTSAAAAESGEGGEQQGGSCSARGSTSSTTSNSLSNSSGWDVEADTALLGLLREDMKVLSEVSFMGCVSHIYVDTHISPAAARGSV